MLQRYCPACHRYQDSCDQQQQLWDATTQACRVTTGRRIHFEFDIDPLEIDVSQAVPLGLILNEAITNSIKYAFPDGKDGVISVSISKTDSHHCLLTISDNGIGISTQLNNAKSGSLGMRLMVGLSEDLGGNFSVENKNGTKIKISFVHDRGDISTNSFS